MASEQEKTEFSHQSPYLRRRNTFSFFTSQDDKSMCRRRLSKKISGDEHWKKVHTTHEVPVIYHQRHPCSQSFKNSLKRLKIPNRTNRLKEEPKRITKPPRSFFRRIYIWFHSKCRMEQGSKSRNAHKCSPKENTHQEVTRKHAINSFSYNDFSSTRPPSNHFEVTCDLETNDMNYVYICNKSADISPLEVNDTQVAPNSNTLQVSSIHVRIRDVSPDRQPLGATSSCPPRKSSCISRLNINFCGTWPLTRKKLDEKEEEEDPAFEKMLMDARSEKHDRLEDFSIPYKDLDFGECIRVGRKRSIYRGRWHGDVTIHNFHEISESEDFWNKVTKLYRVRHENVVLFMGACLEAGHLSIVLSCQDGVSLYEHIHIKREKTSPHSKLQYVRQVSYGMGYLHSREIVHKRLTTRNIFLCPNVKISVMDYGLAEKKYDRYDYACLPRGDLTYIAPEVLCKMAVLPPSFISSVSYTYETDVYAFGTVVYELLTGHHPMKGTPSEYIIWQTCTAQKKSLPNKTGVKSLETLVSKCWAHDQDERPSFQDVSRDLHKNAALLKNHSVSVPDLLWRNTGNMVEDFL